MGHSEIADPERDEQLLEAIHVSSSFQLPCSTPVNSGFSGLPMDAFWHVFVYLTELSHQVSTTYL